jgi:uracil-DNA glycosylase family 4
LVAARRIGAGLTFTDHQSSSSVPRQNPDPPTPAAASRRPAVPALAEADLEELGRSATAEQIAGLEDLVTLGAVAERCTRCDLSATRRSVVFGEGDPRARLVCVGEAPGAREDESGRPFVGRAGKLLDRLLLAVGFQRHEVFICNVLKCRPPQNRNPQPDEIAACSPFLIRQIELIEPRAIVAFGSFAAQTLLQRRESIGRLRGRTHIYQGFPLVVTYHPAALLRNPRWTRKTWEDLQAARRLVDSGAAAGFRPVVPDAAGAASKGESDAPGPDRSARGRDQQLTLTPDG